MDFNEKIIAVSCLPGLTTGQRVELASSPLGIDELLSSDSDTVCSFLPVDSSCKLVLDQSLRWYESFLGWYGKGKNHVTWYGASSYPPQLLHIPNPPFLLCHSGDLALSGPSLSVVGTRNASEKALLASFSLGLECADTHTPIISGDGRGIDRMAHEGCMAADGTTLAVFGCGLAKMGYRDLQFIDRILENGGACISEFHPFASPLAWRLPLRDRIISGLSPVTVVIQAPRGSGALVTANHALAQGREVVVHRVGVPSHNASGTKDLAREGAVVVEGLSDIAGCSKVDYKEARRISVARSCEDGIFPFRMGSRRIGFVP